MGVRANTQKTAKDDERRRNTGKLMKSIVISPSHTNKKLLKKYINTKGTKGHCLKFKKFWCRRDITRHFPSRVVSRWKLLDQ